MHLEKKVDLRTPISNEGREEEISIRRGAFIKMGFSLDWVKALQRRRPTLVSPVVLTDHLAGLKERGFKDPQRMIEKLPPILGLAFKNIDDKLAGLKDRGFNDPRRMIESSPDILSYTFENIDDKLAGLKDRGFNDPRRMIESSPDILSYSFENIDDKLAGLKKRGFKNPQRMIEKAPTIFNYTFKNIDNKLAGLKERGFKDPQRMIEKLPTIFGLAFDNIDAKLTGLEARGFDNPRRMIEKLPTIFGLTFKNIDNKLAGLKERGFKDPQRMIEKAPNILSYAFKSIDRRLRLLDMLIRLYKVPFTVQELMENQRALFSTKIDKIVVLAQMLRKTAQDPQDITNDVITHLLFSNLENVLLAVNMIPDGEKVSTSTLLKMVKKIKAEGYTKEEKRDQIAKGLQHEPKIQQRYFRGYP